MYVAKAVALGALHPETPMEKYLTYEVPTDGLSHLPVVTIPTNPMSGSETNADVQITFDDTGLQAGCAVGCAAFTWMNAVICPDIWTDDGVHPVVIQLSESVTFHAC